MVMRHWMQAISLLGAFSVAMAQVPNPTETNQPVNAKGPMPSYQVTVVSRSIKAVNFHHRQGSTVVGLQGTALEPAARGEARVESNTGATRLKIHVEKMLLPWSVGEGFLTYVVWAITPEGRAENLGELMLDGDHANLTTATDLQTFGLVVTAEPYYAVTQPSDVVVMEGIIKPDTTGTITPIDAKYELLPRGMYLAKLPAGDRVRLNEAKDIPIDLLEARQAMAIARSAQAAKYAPDTLHKAEVDLRNAEAFLRSHGSTKKIQTLARNVTQLAEDARLISDKRMEEEKLEAQRRAAKDQLAAAKSAAEKEARERALAEANKRLAEEQARNAQLKAEREEDERREAERAKTEAQAEQARLRTAAQKAEIEARYANEARQKAEQERRKAREELRRELNTVLETRETARGLIMSMPDVLFDFGKYTLRQGAREKLAKISGILLSHPDLKIEVDGYTDNIGSESFNQTLSDERAESVRTYLVDQGVASDHITARGFGESDPVADNSTAVGRQKNRRVELVVNGESITPIGEPTPDSGGGEGQ